MTEFDHNRGNPPALSGLPVADIVDRGKGIAVWRQIAEQLRGEIIAGAHGEDGRMPGEMELARRFSVNRHTVRRAVAALADDGLVRSERGRGTFVDISPIAYPIAARTRFSEILASQNREPGGRLIASRSEAADGTLAAQLEVPIGAELIRLDSLHAADGVPLSATTSWFEASRFPRLVSTYTETGSITKALQAHGVDDYRRRTTTVLAELASAAVAPQLGIEPGQPLLVAISINVDGEGRPVHCSKARFAAERVEIVINS